MVGNVTCMALLTKLRVSFRHCDCTVGFRMQVVDAVLRSKLLFGLKSAQLKQEHMNQMNKFRVKGLRKMSRMQTTFIDKANTNARVISDNSSKNGRWSKKQLMRFSAA